VKILWTETALRQLDGVPLVPAEQILVKIELAAQYPDMFPVRGRGRYRGYRWIAVGPWVVFYEADADAVVVRAILHGARRGA
jgi:plasmid stabilization system protein ParE